MPVPGVADREQTYRPGGRRMLGRRMAGGSTSDVRRLDCQRAAVRHGVAGVDGEVQDDLLQLAGIGLHRVALRTERTSSSTSSPIRRRSIGVSTPDDRVQVEHLGRDDLLAAEGEQLTGQVGRAFAGVQDLRERLRERIARREPVDASPAVADDDRQQVVEVVRDAAGQPADGFHLLGLAKSLLQTFPFADVAGNAQAATGLPSR